jgi:hypothetical protein
MERRAAAVPSFVYSDAMRERGVAGLVWDAGTLDRYIADPESVVAGTSMSAPPLRDEQGQSDLIAYLALASAAGIFAVLSARATSKPRNRTAPAAPPRPCPRSSLVSRAF